MLIAAVALLFTSCGQTPRDPLQQAKRDYAAGQFNAALVQIEKLGDKGTPEALDLRGCVLMEQGKFDDALAAFDAAHAADPALFAPRLHRGDVFLRQFQYDNARREYQKLLDETNILISNERLRYAMLITYLAEKNDDNAKQTLDAIKFPTESAAFYYAHAAWAFAHNDRKSAEAWLDKAEQMHKADATAWFARPMFELGWIAKKPRLVYSLTTG